MKIGLTYDLRADYLAEGYGEEETAEFDRADTIDAIAGALTDLGHEVDRVGHLRHLVGRLAGGARWDLVFNVAEGLHGFGREAQVPALLDAYRIPYTFCEPLAACVTLHKETAKQVLRDRGIATPASRLIERPEELEGVDLALPLFAKPVAEGTGMGVGPDSVIRRREELRPRCEALLARFPQGVLLETYLPGREFTVGILGTDARAEALGTVEILLLPAAEAEVYSYVNKERCEELVHYKLVRPEDDPLVARCEQVALDAWRALRGRDAGRVDLRADERGEPHVLELNPLAGLHPEHSDLPIIATALGMPYLELIRRIVASAQERVRAAS